MPCPPPGDLPNPGIEPRSSAFLADSLPSEPPEKPKDTVVGGLSLLQRIFPTQELNQARTLNHYVTGPVTLLGSPHREAMEGSWGKREALRLDGVTARDPANPKSTCQLNTCLCMTVDSASRIAQPSPFQVAKKTAVALRLSCYSLGYVKDP